ncbi:MAG: hypothetical protein CMJ49_06255 [Planctomycetaceae bacterium]|nr:hypothetical protein [Planctomycetaceae bacterium]
MCWPVAAAAAVCVIAVTWRGRWRAFGLWTALAIVGQAASLQMIDAGPGIHFQRYRPVGELLSGWRAVYPALVGLQLAAVVVGVVLNGSRMRQVFAWRVGWWRWGLVGAAVVLFAAPVGGQMPESGGATGAWAVVGLLGDFAPELLFAAAVQLIHLGVIVLAVMAVPGDAVSTAAARLDGWLGGEADEARGRGGLDRFTVGVAIWVTVAAAALNVVSYQRHPHVPDEAAYLVQARMLAAGSLSMPEPPVREAFDFYLMDHREGRWFAVPPVGWPAALAVGARVGAAWLVNPVLAGVCVLLIGLVVREVSDRRTARLVVLLAATSPWFIFLAMSFMTHIWTLTCAMFATLTVAWARRTGRVWWTLAGGAAIGMVSLIRPLEGLITAVLLGLWAIGVGGKRIKWAAVALLVIGTVLVGGLVLPYNRALSGEATQFPIMKYIDQNWHEGANALWFGANRGMGWELDAGGRGHDLFDGVVNTALNVFSLNIELHGWAAGSLGLMAIALVWGRRRRGEVMMLAVIGVIVGVHVFYWYHGGPDFGPRYWMLILVPCLALTVRGIDVLGERAGGSGRVLLGVLVMSAIALVTVFPWRASDKYYHYLHMRPDVRWMAEAEGFGDGLVFVRGPQYPARAGGSIGPVDGHPDYASAAVYNALRFDDAGPIYVWDRGDGSREAVMAAYPDRAVWTLEGPSLTEDGTCKIVERPDGE